MLMPDNDMNRIHHQQFNFVTNTLLLQRPPPTLIHPLESHHMANVVVESGNSICHNDLMNDMKKNSIFLSLFIFSRVVRARDAISYFSNVVVI